MEREGSRRRANAGEEREGGKNAAIRSVYSVLRLCFYACGTSACSPSTFGSPRPLLFALTRGGLSGKRGSHLCERRWKQTTNDHSLPVPSPFGCRSADCAERWECGVREGGEEGGRRLGPSAFHLR